jgi:hypothetical protein
VVGIPHDVSLLGDTIGDMLQFPEVAPGEDIVISATAFAAFLACPAKALGRYRGVYPPESPEAFRGMLAHRVFARHLVEGPVSHEELPQVCREEIGKSMNPKLVDLALRPSRLTAIIDEVGDLHQRFTRFPTDGFMAAEVSLEFSPAPGLVLRGMVDAVFGDEEAVRIVDWKTGSLGDAEPQLAFYAMVWVLERGELPASTEAASVATGERYEEIPTPATVAATISQVAAMAGEIRRARATDTDLERRGGPWCRWCPLLDGCSEGSSTLALLG